MTIVWTSPIGIPDDAPLQVGLDAAALSYAIEALYQALKERNTDAIVAADAQCSIFRARLADEGWNLEQNGGGLPRLQRVV